MQQIKDKNMSYKKCLDIYRFNIFSQNGEDGVIEEILKRLNITGKDNWCVEFGAWDGVHLSNTFNLVKNKYWNAVYIEGDSNRFKSLISTSSEFKTINPIKAYVSHDKESQFSLDNILRKTNICKDFELLSIDVDSYDLDIWDSLEDFNPKIVVIEINSSFLPGVFFRNSEKISGNSFSSTLSVGINKGYTLVAHTGNMIFVRNDLAKLIGLDIRFIQYPELLFDYFWVSVKKNSFLNTLKNKIKFILKIN